VQDGSEAVVQAPGIAAADAHHLGERVFDGHVEGKVAALINARQAGDDGTRIATRFDVHAGIIRKSAGISTELRTLIIRPYLIS
jgi:hypothetical protein